MVQFHITEDGYSVSSPAVGVLLFTTNYQPLPIAQDQGAIMSSSVSRIYGEWQRWQEGGLGKEEEVERFLSLLVFLTKLAKYKGRIIELVNRFLHYLEVL